MKSGIIRPPRGRPSKVTKASAPRRLSRGIGADQLAHEFEEHDPALAEDGAEIEGQHHDMTDDVGEAEADAEMDDDAHAQAQAQAQAAAAHAEQQHMDLTAANILANGGIGAAAASMYGDEQHAHGQVLPGGLISGQAGVGALQSGAMPAAQMGSGGGLEYIDAAQQQQSAKSTEEMAVDSGYTNFKIDSAFAKRLARDPGQRLAEQRKPDQELNLVRRSNVEALFAQIAGSLAPQACNHCRKGQGPWTACVLYAGQMMGSCANCWFNASGSRCSFHEKAQPLAPPHHHAYPPLPPGPPVDPATYAGSQLPLPAVPGSAGGVPMGGFALPATYSNDPRVAYTLQRAIDDTRRADRTQRHFMKIEIAAKQLALQIVEFEESGLDEQDYPSPPAAAPDESGT